jgi:hypothetical protein
MREGNSETVVDALVDSQFVWQAAKVYHGGFWWIDQLLNSKSFSKFWTLEN